MRILFLSQLLPYPLDAGPKIRAYYTLRYLSQQHDVTLLSFARETDSPAAIAQLAHAGIAVHTVPMPRSRLRDGWHLLRSLPDRTPFLIARDRVPAMAARLRQLLAAEGPFDAVHADQLWMAPYALLARRGAGHGPRPILVLDQHNAVFQIPRRLAPQQRNPLLRAALRLEAAKLARYERVTCQQFDRVVWVTAEDRAALGLPGAAARSWIIPICAEAGPAEAVRRRPQPHRVTFLGGLHWPPNAEGVRWFAREVWPRVAAQAPEAWLTVMGKQPPVLAGERIEATGYVADPLPWLAETAVFVVPLHAGGGMRVKILDAWRWGLPVVSTSIGAEGIQARDGKNLLLADSAEAFAQAVQRLLREPALAARLIAGGQATLAAHYHWRQVYRAWDQVYRQPLAAPHPLPA